MGLLLVLFCNVRSCVIDLSYSYLYLCHAVSDIGSMILVCFVTICFAWLETLVLVNSYMLQYSYVCSIMISVHPKGGGSA